MAEPEDKADTSEPTAAPDGDQTELAEALQNLIKKSALRRVGDGWEPTEEALAALARQLGPPN